MTILNVGFQIRQIDYHLSTDPSEWPRWSHQQTVALGDGRTRCTWAAEVGECPTYLEFDVVAVLHDVFALADLSAIRTNLRLLDKRGIPLSEAACLVALNLMVRNINWQVYCQRAHSIH